MKISLCFASRNAAANLETVIRVFQNLSSGQHEIKYVVGLDNDDLPSCARITKEFHGDKSVIISMADRPIAVGEVWNRCVREWDADVYIPVGDDTFCLSQHWDMYVAELAPRYLVLNSYMVVAPGAFAFPFMQRKWIDACGYMFPPHFTYWFTDTWVQELYEFTVGEEMTINTDVRIGGAVSKTRGMRDLDFWWGFFNATRVLRLAEAESIRDKLNIPPLLLGPPTNIINKWNQRDIEMRPRIPELSLNAVDSEPSDRYLKAKNMAEKYLADHNLNLWQHADNMANISTS